MTVAILTVVVGACSGSSETPSAGTSAALTGAPASSATAVVGTPAAGNDPVSGAPGTPAVVQVAIIGDSYTAGSDVGGHGGANWTAVATQLLEADGYPVELAVLGLSGSGYVRVGGTGLTFTDGVPKVVTDRTQLVVVFGSINDGSSSPGAVAASADMALQRIEHAAPHSLVVIIGPQWVDGNPPANILALRDAVASAVAGHPSATFVDPLAEDWFGGASSSLIGSDGLHPTDAGHRHLAELIAPRIAGAMDAIRAGS